MLILNQYVKVCRDVEVEECSDGSPAACNTIVEQKCQTAYPTTLVDK